MICNIETFDKSVQLDSTYLSCISEMLNMLTIRIKNGEEKVEYRFYDVLEYTQENVTDNVLNELTIDNSSQWYNQVSANGIDYIFDFDVSDYKHYRFIINGIKFNILAPGYIKENEFIEMYTKQQIIKDIIKGC